VVLHARTCTRHPFAYAHQHVQGIPQDVCFGTVRQYIMGLLARKEPMVLEVCQGCIAKCQALVKAATQPGLQCKEQCKQLHRFARNVMVPLEDLIDNSYVEGSKEAKAVSNNIKHVRVQPTHHPQPIGCRACDDVTLDGACETLSALPFLQSAAMHPEGTVPDPVSVPAHSTQKRQHLLLTVSTVLIRSIIKDCATMQHIKRFAGRDCNGSWSTRGC
jgi:hypothetical protein